MAAVAFLAVWRVGFWGPFEPRELEISREQYASGDLVRVPTFSGMPFLEKPLLYYDLVALGFGLAGGPSVLAARLVNAALMLVWLAAVLAAAPGRPERGRPCWRAACWSRPTSSSPWPDARASTRRWPRPRRRR